MNNKSGIYTITSPSGKQYVGSAANFQGRWRAHLHRLRKGRHHSPPLQSAWDKYGEERMVFSIILLCSKQDLVMYEQRAIDVLRPKYNICQIAGSSLGRKHSDLHRAKISAALKGRDTSDEHRKNLSLANKGKKPSARCMESALEYRMKNGVSQETRRKMSEAAKGKIVPGETRRKLSAAMTGKSHSEETRKKLSGIHTGKKLSLETIQKIGAANRGKKRSEEFCQRMSALNKGKGPPAHAILAASAARSRSVRCVETGDVFKTVRDATIWLVNFVNPRAAGTPICRVCGGKAFVAYGYHWEYVISPAPHNVSDPNQVTDSSGNTTAASF